MLRKLSFILFVLILSFLTTTIGSAELVDKKESKRVILITLSGISAEDLASGDLPNIKDSLTKNAAVGLMNSRAGKGAPDSPSSYLSIGVGARARAGKFGNLAVDKGEKVEFRGSERSFPVPGLSQVLSPSFPEMSRLNSKLSYTAIPGTLGDLLRQAGIKRAVFGNTDALGNYHREINLIAMDTDGLTSQGSVNRKVNDPDSAFAAVEEGLKSSQFVALEYGEAAGIGYLRDFLTDRQVDLRRKRSLQNIDELFGRLSKTFSNKETMIIMVAPYPPIELAKSKLFQTPIIIAAEGYKGLLTSTSTRWRGMIANSDIAPTILSFLGLETPAHLRGRPIKSAAADDALADIENIEKKSFTNFAARSQLLSAFITVVIIILVTTTLIFLLGSAKTWSGYLQPLLLALTFFPAVALLANIVDYPTPTYPLIIIPLVSLGAGFVTWLIWRQNPIVAVTVPSLIAFLAIIIQLFIGSILERNSVMGMSSIIGARFYGVGNEYTGVLLATAALSLTAFFAKQSSFSKKKMGAIALSLFLILTFVIGFPSLGANVGGALAAIALGIVLTLLLQEIRLTGKHALFILLGMGAAVGVILGADYFSSSSSHAARAVSSAKASGGGQIVNIITRKLATNIRLIKFSSWTNILSASAFAVIALKIGAAGTLAKLNRDYSLLLIGIRAIVIGSVVALLLNDSGVVTAAIMVLYAVCAWFYLLLNSSRSPASQ